MKSFTTLKNLATNLSNNTSTDNDTLMGQLINDQHRYLIQKYFDNERTFQTATIGAMSLTLTGALAIGATSATLSSAWSYPTCTQLVNFSSGEQRSVLFTYNSTAITWSVALTKVTTTAISTVGVQKYLIPANISKITNDTITIGQLRYTPAPIVSRGEWDWINTLPYTSDIPNYYYLYAGNLEIFPIPSTTGNVLTFNYKTRVPDMTFADYSTGTIANAGMVAGSTSITGSGTTWTSYPQNTDIQFLNLYFRADPATGGDGIWYPILKFTGATTLTLANPVINAPSIGGTTTYTIGQMPLLHEDFHDMIVYGALQTYYASIVDNPNKMKEFLALYDRKLELLEAYAGTKSTNVDLGPQHQPENPNIFLYANI